MEMCQDLHSPNLPTAPPAEPGIRTAPAAERFVSTQPRHQNFNRFHNLSSHILTFHVICQHIPFSDVWLNCLNIVMVAYICQILPVVHVIS